MEETPENESEAIESSIDESQHHAPKALAAAVLELNSTTFN
jgi:hypothetical protein